MMMMMLQFRWEIPFDQLALEVAQTRNSIFVALLHFSQSLHPFIPFRLSTAEASVVWDQ